MPGGHGTPGDAGGALGLPERQRVEQALHHAVGAPQHQGVAGDLVAARATLAVVFQVDAGAGAVVLAGGVDCLLYTSDAADE